MRQVLTVDVLQSYIGECARDPYGRVVGRIVSIESEIDGTVKRVALEDERKMIRFVEAEAVKIQGGSIIIEPEWKVDAMKILSNHRTAIKRLRGLEEIYSRNDIPTTIYREMRRKLEASIAELKERARKLREKMKRRLREIEDENFKLDKAIAELQVSYFAGEIGEKAYKVAIDALRQAKDSNVKECEEIKKFLQEIEAIIEGKYEPKTRVEEAKAEKQEQEQKKEESVVKSGIQPIPVKVVGLS